VTSLNSTGLLNIVLTWRLVFSDEIRDCILAKPVGQSRKFLAKAIYRLHIHVGLRDQLWKGDCNKLAMIHTWKETNYLEDDTNALLHKNHLSSFRTIHHSPGRATLELQGTGCAQILRRDY
jgi:hypothetical protein